jgi:hypothetical protein
MPRYLCCKEGAILIFYDLDVMYSSKALDFSLGLLSYDECLASIEKDEASMLTSCIVSQHSNLSSNCF